MAFRFIGDIEELKQGIGAICPVSLPDYTIAVEKATDGFTCVTKEGEGFRIVYNEKVQFFRALSYVIAHGMQADFQPVREKAAFSTCGIMIDVSQGNAVLKIETVFSVLRKMAFMGLNMLMLYTEDNFVMEGEPYFGYFRGRYTKHSLKQIDDYGAMLGIEVIPCVQTLAHLIDALKWDAYKDIKDDDDTLLVGEAKTYALIEKIIKTVSEPFRTKRIHIGMDEAWKLGQGNYLRKNGYRPKFDIMTEHLSAVLQITKKYGLEPIMWSDMYFCAGSEQGFYYDEQSVIPQEVCDNMPAGVQLCYWDYYHKNREFYREWIKRHKRFGADPMFACGIWNWNSFAVDYDTAFATITPAMAECRAAGLTQVFATLWGDGTTECPLPSTYLGMQLLAEHRFYENPHKEHIAQRFADCTGGNFDDFYAISALDVIPGQPRPQADTVNPSKYLMWQDPLLGLFDENVKHMPLGEHYGALVKQYEAAAQRNGPNNYVFEFYTQLAHILKIKAMLGNRLYDAYKNADKEALLRLCTSIGDLVEGVKRLHGCHREIWYELYMPFGFEILDIRYGGLLLRLQTVQSRLIQYLQGDIPVIEELEEERLLFDGKEGLVLCMPYARIVSASRLSFSFGF